MFIGDTRQSEINYAFDDQGMSFFVLLYCHAI